ncbi:hypothetical protein [Streptomyces chartreusis]|uniref:hypothetical protein n=1 Tax=Streptomyces chartreusis TaxID=1969 RepID=UPI00366A22D9
MSTPAPAPAAKDSSTDAPFDPHGFPVDLVAAQRKAAELSERLRTLQAQLPWSREPHPGWPAEEERGRERPGRPESPGWTEQEAAEFDRLLEELRSSAAVVQTHPWWERCKAEGIEGPALVQARQALKRAEGAVLLARDDVDAAA